MQKLALLSIVLLTVGLPLRAVLSGRADLRRLEIQLLAVALAYALWVTVAGAADP
jgi:hypothetical protein